MPLYHPDRHWRLHGASNFRDLGGYPTADGRQLRWKQLYRSDHLGGLTADDQAALQRAGVTRSLDFRGVHERAETPYHVPGLTQHTLAIEPTVVQRMHDLVAQGQQLTAADTVGLMEELYRSLVLDAAPQFAAFFHHVLSHDGALVFHCTAGKDRTGFAAALLLLALGVPRALVLQDYLLTNELYRRPPMPPGTLPTEAVAVLWRVQASFLEAALQAIEQQQGGLDTYLAQALGVGPAERQALARRCLQAA